MKQAIFTMATALTVAPILVLSAPRVAATVAGCPGGTTPQPGPVGTICVPVEDPGTGGGGGGGSGAGSGGSAPTCQDDGRVIPCVDSNGSVWDAAHSCYSAKLDPQPPAGAPEWDGHDPDEGSLWACDLAASEAVRSWFVPNGQAQSVDPVVLARRALGRLRLAVPDIHMAPQPPAMTYVGLETWLWMDPQQWQTLGLTVTAGATAVTVRAAPVVAAWNLTEGTTTCDSPGRAWLDTMTDADRTDCSFTFHTVSDGQPGGRFRVSATLTYQVDWTCSGQCLAAAGTLGHVDGVGGAAAIRVGERQSVVVS